MQACLLLHSPGHIYPLQNKGGLFVQSNKDQFNTNKMKMLVICYHTLLFSSAYVIGMGIKSRSRIFFIRSGKFANSINDTSGDGGKFADGVVDTGGKLMLLKLVLHLDLQISLRIFKKI
jgi:hypothetical protein